jgi:hypothetical protein
VDGGDELGPQWQDLRDRQLALRGSRRRSMLYEANAPARGCE